MAISDAPNGGLVPIHVTIGQSIAQTLRLALHQLGRTEPVVGLPVDLAIGPIDPANTDPAWSEATDPTRLSIIWACLSSPMEHAGFLAFAAHMRGRPFDFVDATDLDFTTRDGIHRPSSLGMMRAEDIVASNLYARRRSLSSKEHDVALAAWSNLCRENAPFRIVEAGRLISAPLTLYDPLLIEHAGLEWEVAAALIGRVVSVLSTPPAGRSIDGDALFGRVLALAGVGALQLDGSGPGMRDYRVRKPEA